MTPFDYAVLVILLASMALGAWRGVIGEIIAVAAWVLAFFAARWWGETFALELLSGIGDPVVRLSLHRSVENRRFFDGGWLEWWSFMLALRHLLNVGTAKTNVVVGHGAHLPKKMRTPP